MHSPKLRSVISLSIAAAVVTIGMKSAAYAITGSVGLLSDALESGINFVAAVTAYFSLWYSARPVDATHTYGHEKIEFFSSGLEGMFIVIAGGAIIWTAVQRMITPVPLERLDLGAGIALAASLVNLVVARILIIEGKKHQSIVLEADGRHLMTDVWTSVAVVGAIALVWATGWQVLDPLIAILVALNIGWTGYGLMRRSINGLMDHAIPAEEQEKLRAAVQERLPAGTSFHALRTRQAGARRFADFHLLVPGKLSVRDAHNLAERIEEALRALFPALEVTIHIEPIEAVESWNDNVLAGIEPKAPAATPPS
jgi:cation diffusion facilitator family transporter